MKLISIHKSFLTIILNQLIDIEVNCQNSLLPGTTLSANVCFKCNSNDGTGGDCFHNPTGNCNSNTKYCYIQLLSEGDNMKKNLRRGCVGDDLVPSQEICTNNLQACIACSIGDKCNNKNFNNERCIKTEYAVNNPIIGSNEQSSVECPISLDPLGCYHFERNGMVNKGCVSSLDKKLQNEIKSSKDCEICFGPNCNSKLSRMRKCIYCDGPTDLNCADTPQLHQTINCEDSCLVGVDVNGFTHRQCASNQLNDTQQYPNGFDLCQNDSCNANIFPNNRLKCFQCNGDIDCSFRTSNVTAQRSSVCQMFSRYDQCYTHFGTGKQNNPYFQLTK